MLKFGPCNWDGCDCSVEEGSGDYWDVSCSCPGPERFPLGQSCRYKLNKKTGIIKDVYMTN